MLDSKIGIRKSLRFDSLRSVNDKYRAFAGCKRTRNFVIEVDVAGRIDKIENVILAVVCGIFQAYRASFYRYAAFAFDIHVVKKLIFHIAYGDRLGFFENSVGES